MPLTSAALRLCSVGVFEGLQMKPEDLPDPFSGGEYTACSPIPHLHHIQLPPWLSSLSPSSSSFPCQLYSPLASQVRPCVIFANTWLLLLEPQCRFSAH